MVCLIKQDGALVVAWFIGRSLEDVAVHCYDDALTDELLTNSARYAAYGNYRLQGGKYTLLVGSIDGGAVDPG